MDKLWEKVADGLADRGLISTYGPVMVFLAGGLLAYKSRYGIESLLDVWNGHSLVTQAAFVVIGIFLLAFISYLVEDLQSWVIKLAEGYFPDFLDSLRISLSVRWSLKISNKQRQLSKYDRPANKAQNILKRRLDAEVAHLPVDSDNAMPTLLGNILLAAEDYPEVRYGLNAVVCWPRLYPLLPDTLRLSINSARGRLNESAGLLTWSLLFLVWLGWQWWAILSLVVTFIAYRGMISAAGVYGDLIRSAFDLHRFELYKALKWPPPGTPDGEERIGKELTIYLFRGFSPSGLIFETQATPAVRATDV